MPRRRVVDLAIQDSARSFFSNTAPLLEEKEYPLSLALFTYRADPIRVAATERVVRYLCRRYAARLIYRIGTVG